MTIAAVLLAAGRSTRFGEADKLLTPLQGRALGLHAAETLKGLPLDHHFVVTPPGKMAWPGFEVVANDDPDAGLSRSLMLGVAAARVVGADAVLIALADMPFVPANHFLRILERYSGAATLVASSDGASSMPPALFGEKWLPKLGALVGDRGARDLLNIADRVFASPEHLADIDFREDLIGLQP